MRDDQNSASWVKLYHSALLELDLKELAARISDAEKAIQRRKRELNGTHEAAAELQALADAFNNLAVLRKELPGQSTSGTVIHIHPELKGDYVAVVNANRQYVAVTDGVCRLLGYSRAELLAKTIDEVTAPEMATDVPVQFEEYVNRGFMEGTHLLVGRDGERIAIRYEARTFSDGCFVARWEPIEKAESLAS